ncbi:hypothetical protein ABMC89_11905 [Sulfitobacter sp. HNIBRBA3233]|uniref:hypothetical protein n=1 Tax=Sulfitobacter marinivivus TaxID=3158558 RepID=UPI0032DF5A65
MKESKKVSAVASAKKTGPSKAKSSTKKPAEPKPEDMTSLENTPDGGDEAPKAAEVESANKTTEAAPAKVEKIEVTTAAVVSGSAKASATDDASDAKPIEGVVPAAKPDADKTEETKGEATSTPLADTTHPVPAPVAAETSPRNNTFLPLVLGGIIAGVIGFAAAEYDLLTGTAGDDPAIALQEEINTQNDRIAALEQAEPAPVEAPTVDLSQIETQLADLETRLTELENRPVVTPPEGMDAEEAEAYITELSDLQRAVQQQRSEIEDLIANARSVEAATAEAARAANARAALTKIVSAIDAGQPFNEDLETLSDAEGETVEPALQDAALDGVATLAELQTEYPDQARAALSASRAAGEEGQGVGGFLKRQLGVRSVTPREGDNPDAILSRAEAAVQQGDLDTALAELDALPDAGKSAMSEWIAAAQARVDAREAADAMAQRLTAD